MPTFKCKVALPGSRSIIEKTLVGNSGMALKKHLESEGHFVLEIRLADGSGSLLRSFTFKHRIRSGEFFTFNQEFAVLLKAGIPVVGALDTIIENSEKSEINRVLQDIRKDIAAGESLSGAFDKYGHLFSKLYVASLRTGEKSGDVTSAIARYLEHMKKMAEIKQKVISASVYPAILTIVSVFTLLFLLIYVVPTFTQSFFESGTQLPAVTLYLIKISNLFRYGFPYILTGCAGLSAGIIGFYKSDMGRLTLDRWKLMIPFIGTVYRHYFTSGFSRTLATVLSGGIPLPESVQIAAGAMDNHFVKQRLETVMQEIGQGVGFADSLAGINLFPPLAVRMINAGESGGALPMVLGEIADFYDNDVNTRLTILTSAVEPGLMVLMGLLIGFIVVAMYMPVFQLAETIS